MSTLPRTMEAVPLATPDDIVAALRDYRCTVIEWPGWRERGARSRTTGRLYPFDPYAQAWHHDAFQEGFGDLAAARFMFEQGRPDLPPPLSNGTIGNYGTVYLGAYHNANHAGRNEADVHDRLSRGLAPLGDARQDPDGDSIVGNTHLWGWECRNAGTGRDPWDQLDVMIRAGAAMADACGWNAMASAGHRELTARKPDPAGFDMTAFRAAIARAQAAHNAPPQEDDMAATFVMKAPGHPTRFVAPPLAVPIGTTTEKGLNAKGVPTFTFTKEEATKIVDQVGRVLDDADVVKAIQDA